MGVFDANGDAGTFDYQAGDVGPRGTSYLLHRMGFSPQVRAHRAAERDEDAIAAWRARTWAKVRG
jgi:transposase